jgi:four helix bundle protein
MLKDFRTYQLAIQFHRECQKLKLPFYLKDQMLRASSSVALNLAEGSAKPTKKDQMKFYYIAMGSLRECQAILDITAPMTSLLTERADHLGASLYRLTRS